MGARIVTSTRRRPRFNDLRIADVERLTEDSVAITFEVPSDKRGAYAFEPGQYLTLRRSIDGEDVRRSYSICMSKRSFASTGEIRVASARVHGGAMSNWLYEHAKIGGSVQVMTPLGNFTCPTKPELERRHVGIAAGSGITPVLSMLWTALEEEPKSQVTLVLGNRNPDSVMFGEELQWLQQTYGPRFSLISAYSRLDTIENALRGRIDEVLLNTLLYERLPVADVDEWYVCGPEPMVRAARRVLVGRGADRKHVHQEVFYLEELEEGRGA